ncbi:MAG: UvrD-helicase domain-containing protein, partial [Acutalibacteraceae bacterium]
MAIKKSEKNWTLEQQYGITADCGCVLVSAAAGSGKTSVLTERVITKITDPKNPIDIDKFLIITFTKAAAQEMKTRISARLQELIKQNPEDSNLHRQKFLLKTAQIGTIHSFCSGLLKENFFKAGISHKFRIADDEELAKIKAAAIEKVLNHFFEVDSNDNILTADLFTDEKSDTRLSEIIKSVYEYTRSLPFPQKWMDKKIKMYDNIGSSLPSAWEQKIIDYTKFVASELLSITNETLELIKTDESIQKAYEKSISSDKDSILKIVDLANMKNFENISIFLGNLK